MKTIDEGVEAVSDTIQLPRAEEMILRLGEVIGLAGVTAEARNDETAKASVLFVHQAIRDAIDRSAQ